MNTLRTPDYNPTPEQPEATSINRKVAGVALAAVAAGGMAAPEAFPTDAMASTAHEAKASKEFKPTGTASCGIGENLTAAPVVATYNKEKRTYEFAAKCQNEDGTWSEKLTYDRNKKKATLETKVARKDHPIFEWGTSQVTPQYFNKKWTTLETFNEAQLAGGSLNPFETKYTKAMKTTTTFTAEQIKEMKALGPNAKLRLVGVTADNNARINARIRL